MPSPDEPIKMWCHGGTHDKVYIIRARWHQFDPTRMDVFAEYGRRGGSLQTVVKATLVRPTEAYHIMQNLAAEKNAKGYERVIHIPGVDSLYTAPPAPTPRLRPTPPDPSIPEPARPNKVAVNSVDDHLKAPKRRITLKD